MRYKSSWEERSAGGREEMCRALGGASVSKIGRKESGDGGRMLMSGEREEVCDDGEAMGGLRRVPG